MWCRAKLFEVQTLHCMSNVIEMYRNNLEGLLLYLYRRDNKYILHDIVLTWLGKLPCPGRQCRGFSLSFFFPLCATVSENIWCVWLCTAMGVIFVFSRIHYTTWHCVCYAHYENQQSIMSDVMYYCVKQKADDGWWEQCRLPLACRLTVPLQVLYWGGEVMLIWGWYNGLEVTGDLMRGTWHCNVFCASAILPMQMTAEWRSESEGRKQAAFFRGD